MRRLDLLAALVAVAAVSFLACSDNPERAIPQTGGTSTTVNDSAGSVAAPPTAPTTVEAPTTTTTTSEPERVVPATAAPPVEFEPTTTTTTAPPPTTSPPAVHGRSVWDDLADCESGNGVPGSGTARWHINTGNGYYGGIQFSLRSWRWVGGTGYPHEHSRETQIEMGERLRARQGWGAWPACSKKMGLR